MREGRRCGNYIDVERYPDERLCHVHREGFEIDIKIPETVAAQIAEAMNTSPRRVHEVLRQFNRTVYHISSQKNAKYERQGRSKRILAEEVQTALCCDPQEYRMLVALFRKLAVVMNDNGEQLHALVSLHIGFLIFFALYKFEQNSLDLNTKLVAHWVKQFVGPSKFLELYVRYATTRSVVQTLFNTNT
jgi:hypothetical protein